jgi:outer membrane protein assembly factor BamA
MGLRFFSAAPRHLTVFKLLYQTCNPIRSVFSWRPSADLQPSPFWQRINIFPRTPPLCYSSPIMKRKFFLLITAIVVLAGSQLSSQERFVPKTIQFKGAPEYANQELLAAAGLQKGASIAYPEVKVHAQKLLDTGLFESSDFTYNGVDLVFNMVPSTTLYPVRLENLPLTPGKELDAALHDRLPLYHGKVPSEGGLTEDVRQALEKILAAKGIKATVAATPYTDLKTAQVTAMSFAITSPPVRVGEIHLEGVSPDLQDKVKAVAARAMKSNFDTENAAINLENSFTLFYSDEGYATAKVHAQQSGNPVMGSAAIEVPFIVSVEPGRRYKLGSIRLPSGELLNLAQINKATGVATNSVETKMSISGGLTLRSALFYVAGQYKSKGYMDCVVTPRPQYDDANGIVNYTLEVDPGPVYTMGKLTIDNIADDLRAAMLAAWKMPTGAVFNGSAMYAYYYTQGDTALGRTFASANCTYKLATNHETHTVDVTLRLERKR